MSTRIQGSAAQSVPTPETTEAEVEQSRTAEASKASAAKAKAQEASGPLDSLEHADAREGADAPAAGQGQPSGPSIPGHLLHATGGRGGHQILKEKEQQEAEAKKEAEREAAKDEAKARVRQGETPHYETKGSAGNSIRDRNWASHARTLEHTHQEATLERQGRRVKWSVKAPTHSPEPKATSHRQQSPKSEVGAKLWEHELGRFDESGKTLASGKHGRLTLLEVQGHAGAKAELGDGALKAQAQIGAAAYLVNARAHGEHKGTVDYSGAAYLNVGAHAQAQGALELDPKKMAFGAKAGMEAFAGVTAGVNGKVGAGGIEAGGEARVEAGIGFEANATAELKDGKLAFKTDLGVCVGVGADVKFNVEIDARKIAQEADQAGRYLERKEQELAGAVEQAALEGVASAASHAFSFLQKASAVAHAVESGAEALAEAASQS